MNKAPLQRANRRPPSGSPTREEIELRAHQTYVERGGAQGRDVEDWLQAERELLGKYEKTGRLQTSVSEPQI